MGIEPSIAAGRKGSEFTGSPEETTTNNSKSAKKNRRKQRKQMPVQTLFEACKEVFANGGTGFIPPPDDVERLRSILGMNLISFHRLICDISVRFRWQFNEFWACLMNFYWLKNSEISDYDYDFTSRCLWDVDC